LRELHEPVATSASGAANAAENGTDMKTDSDTTEPKAEADADASAQAPLGAQILDEFAKGFRGYLDRLAWRETRLCVSIDCSLFIIHWIQWMRQTAVLGPLF
jgi:hypothetical protein